MPSHVRQQLREAAATLVTGLATTGSRVYQSRVYPLKDTDLPCLLVNTDEEEVEALSIHAPALLDRRLTLTVRGVALSTANLDDTLDSIATEVETALGNTTLGGLAKSLVLQGISVDMDDTVQKPLGVLALRYLVNYHTTATAPTTAL